MFNSLKKSLGYLPDRSESLAVFKYVSTFKNEKDSVKIINCDFLKVSITHHFFRHGQEIEILFQGQSPSLKYHLNRPSYKNSDNHILYDMTEKVSNNKFLLLLDSNLSSAQFVSQNRIKEGFIFSNVDLSPSKTDEERLILAINDHFKKWFKENKFLYEVSVSADGFILLWVLNILEEVPILSTTYQIDSEIVEIIINRIASDFVEHFNNN